MGTSSGRPPQAAIAGLVILGIAILGAAGWWLLGRAPASPLPDSPPEIPAASESRQSGGYAPNPSAERVSSDRVPISNTAPWTVRGVAWRGSEPFSGARLQAELFSGYEADEDAQLRAELEADANGVFIWHLGPPEQTVTVRIRSDVPGAEGASVTRRVLEGERAPDDLQLWIYPLDSRIEGRVTTSAGAGIPDATILITRDRRFVTTDAEGHYSIAVSSMYSSVSVQVAGPGYAYQRNSVQSPAAGEAATQDFVLLPALVISGRVIDEDRRPVAGAAVQTTTAIFYKPVLTDTAGYYVLDYLESVQQFHRVFARKPGYVEATAEVHTDDLQDSYELILTRGARVEGVVSGPAGPVVGAELTLGFARGAYNKLTAVSRDDGDFAFPHVAPGKHNLYTDVAGLASDIRVLEVPGEPPVFRVVVELESTRSVAGQVVDAGGRPLRKISIYARQHLDAPLYPDERGEDLGLRGLTDEEGRFVLQGLPPDAVDIEVDGTGYLPHIVRDVAAGAGDLHIVLERSARLEGRVIDGRTGKPIEDFRIRFVDAEGGGYDVTWTRSGRQFRSSGGYWNLATDLRSDARFSVEASAEGYGRVILPMTASVDPEHVVFELFPGHSVQGRVLDRNTGQPVSGARVFVFDALHPLKSGSESHYGRIASSTDDDGFFRLVDVPTGEISLAVQHVDWPFVTDGPFEIAVGQPVERLIFLDVARLRGTVYGIDGRPMRRVSLRLRTNRVGLGPNIDVGLRTDEEGRFVYGQGLPSGSYMIYLDRGNRPEPQIVISRSFEVEIGDDLDLRLEPRGDCSLEGTVIGEGMDVPPVVDLDIIPDNKLDERFFARAVDGNISLQGVPAGDLLVQAIVNYASGSARVTLQPGSTGHVELRLKPLR